MENKKINIPQKGAGRRLADRLKKLGQRKPPEELLKKINQEDRKKVASSKTTSDLDL